MARLIWMSASGNCRQGNDIHPGSENLDVRHPDFQVGHGIPAKAIALECVVAC
jgi:hypothetical protein